MRVFEARKKFAIKEAQRIQGFLDRGYLVMDGKERVKEMRITNNDVRETDGNYNKIWFSFDREADDGAYTPIPELRALFRGLEIFKPVSRRKK